MILKRFRALFVTFILLTAALAASTPSRDDVFLEHLRYLASDALKGRGNNQPEINTAADYIAHYFKEYGLKPIGEDRTFFQYFELTTGYKMGSENSLSFFQLPSNPVRLEPGTDYVALTYGPEVSVTGGMVFAGFGISAPEHGYDDYKDLDVRDKAVVIYEHGPQDESPQSSGDRDWSSYYTVVSKVLNAKHRGAAAVILIPDYFNHRSVREWSDSQEDSIEELGIHAIRLSDKWGRHLMGFSNQDVRAVQESINERRVPASFALDGFQMALSLDVKKVRSTVKNVVGFVPGQSEDVILIGAHYDHLGLGGKNSLSPDSTGQVHNGADDNASGTAGLLALARQLAETRPAHGLLFVAFAGEELGLLGSRHYAENPIFPLKQTLAMLNMDMIGRSTGDLLIGGLGTAAEFKPILEKIRPGSPLNFRYAETPQGSSDHLSFSIKKVPVLFFFSGLHSDYHKPSDDWDRIDLPRSHQVLEVIENVISQLDKVTGPLQFVDMGGAPDPHAAMEGRSRGYGPSFGSIPDMGYESGGVRFAQIREGTPAARAGLQGGDILVEFAGQKIDNLYDFTYALRSHKPGDEVEVVVLREEQRLKVKVLLEARR